MVEPWPVTELEKMQDHKEMMRFESVVKLKKLLEIRFGFFGDSLEELQDYLDWVEYEYSLKDIPEKLLRDYFKDTWIWTLKREVLGGEIRNGDFFHPKLEEDVSFSHLESGHYVSCPEKGQSGWLWYENITWSFGEIASLVRSRRKTRRLKNEK